jgi:hypothetical protein
VFRFYTLFFTFLISVEAAFFHFGSNCFANSSFSRGPAGLGVVSCKSLFELRFAETFRDRNAYCAGFCDDNVHGFLLKLQKERIDLSQVRVLLLLYNSAITTQEGALQSRSLKPESARSPESAPQGWTYHVLVEYQGRIYDFDYGLRPEAPLARDYFQKMWIGSWRYQFNQLERIMMRAIPAQEFLKIYNPENLEGFKGLRFSDGPYPIISVEEFLTTKLSHDI